MLSCHAERTRSIRPSNNEVPVEVGRAIRDRSGLDNLFITTLTNDSIGYVCHAAAYAEGAYEPTRGTNLAEGAGEAIIASALALIDEMKSPS